MLYKQEFLDCYFEYYLNLNNTDLQWVALKFAFLEDRVCLQNIKAKKIQ